MFGARKEDNKWRLSVKKGKTLHGTAWPDNNWKEFVFRNRYQAVACSEELNEKHWEAWANANSNRSKKTPVTYDHAKEMLEIIDKYIV